jgi:phosphohistidine phosphatase
MGYPESMLTLSLLRHAKSSWDDAELQDFDRPLSKRGESAGPRMGAYMAEQGLNPDLIICSPAVRARQTLDLVLPRLVGDPTVTFEDNFYLAAPSVMLARIRQIEANVRHAMIVGHDPGMHGLALELSGSGEAENLNALAAKFPTAGLAVIGFKVRDWSKIGPGKGRLQLFVTPKMLA